MLQSQRTAYRLNEKLNQISTDEYCEFQRLEVPAAFTFDNIPGNSPEYDAFVSEYKAYQNTVLSIRAKFSRSRSRAIWWSLHGTDLFALGVVVFLVVVGAWFFFF